jgi:hypothetical protein
MGLLDHLDNYCERLDAGLWAEPVNAATNIAFFIAACALYKQYKTTQTKNPSACLLIALVAIVGLGSLLFHTFANVLTMWMDVVPIGIFVYAYLWIALRRLLGLHKSAAILAMALFTALIIGTSALPEAWHFNGSVAYFPCLLAVLLMAWAAKARLLFLAAGCFALSLTFRSVDILLCSALPLGSHFLWHILNGLVLYLLVKAIIESPVTPAK